MISEELKEKYKGVDLAEAYKNKFGEWAPFYDMCAENLSDEEWEEIIIKALEESKPYEVEVSDDPDVLY